MVTNVDLEMHHPGIGLEILSKIMDNFSQPRFELGTSQNRYPYTNLL
jgi:hypothetical protein